MLRELLDPKGRSDGFLDRFLLAYPDPLPFSPWTERGLSEETADNWYAPVARLWERPLNVKEERAVPHAARFTVEDALSKTSAAARSLRWCVRTLIRTSRFWFGPSRALRAEPHSRWCRQNPLSLGHLGPGTRPGRDPRGCWPNRWTLWRRERVFGHRRPEVRRFRGRTVAWRPHRRRARAGWGSAQAPSARRRALGPGPAPARRGGGNRGASGLGPRPTRAQSHRGRRVSRTAVS
jgi:hypothetical protein